MLSVVKAFIAVVLLCTVFPVVAKDIYILRLEENGVADCKGIFKENLQGIYRIEIDGEERELSKIRENEDCLDEEVFLPFAKGLINKGEATRVFFMSVSQKNTHLIDWLGDSKVQKDLSLAIKTSNLKNIKFDYGIWQGSLIDREFFKDKYVSNVRKVIKLTSLKVPVEKWVIGLSSSCDRRKDEMALTIRREPLLNRFAGPDIGILNEKYRSDVCTLNEKGLDSLAKLWKDAIIFADEESKKYQKESLLYYFK